jgi:hypothetical protein
MMAEPTASSTERWRSLRPPGIGRRPVTRTTAIPVSMLRFAELYFSEDVRQRIWPHVDLSNRRIAVGNLEDLRLRVLGLLRLVFCLGMGQET